MKKLILICLIVLITITSLLPSIALAQSTIDGDIGDISGFQYPFQRKTFYASELYWVFYADGATAKYSTSPDRTNWTDGLTSLGKSVPGPPNDRGGAMGIHYDGAYVHLAIEAGGHTDYRRAIPNADGSLTWSAAWQLTGAEGYPTVAVDTTGRPWIGSKSNNNVLRSSTTDGTWVEVDLGNHGAFVDAMIPLTNGKMVVVGATTNGPVRVEYNDGFWGAVRDTVSHIEHAYRYSAVAQDDNVHIVFLELVNDDIIHVEYSYSTNSFGAETIIYTGATATSAPVITRDSLNNLYVFWENDPVNDHMYYIKYDYLSSTWGNVVDLIDESIIDGLPAVGYYLNTDYISNFDRIGIYYVADPQKLKYKDVAEVGDVTTLTPSPITDTTATLRGDITSVGTGAITVRGFQYNTEPSATGAGFTQESGAFSTGVYSLLITDLEADSLYYVRAYVTNSEGTTYGEWISFLTAQGEQSSPWNPVGNTTLVPVPSEPGDWFNPSPDAGNISSTWLGSILNPFLEASGFPVEFLWWVIFILILEIVGIMAYGVGKHTLIVFIFGSVILGFICSASLIDWWLIFVYITVGIPFLILESRRF